MKKILPLIISIIFLFTGCATTVFIQAPEKLKGKKIGVGVINISQLKKSKNINTTDTLCLCIAQATVNAFYPSLQKAGFKVISMPETDAKDINKIIRVADSLKVDYVLLGTGIVDIIGHSSFMEKLTIKMVDIKTAESPLSGSFSGSGVGSVKAAQRIGKLIVRKMK